VHGTRGIGRNIFHQHPLSLPEIAVSVLFASTVYLLQYLAIKTVVISEIQKAGTCNLTGLKIGAGEVQRRLHCLSNLQRGGAENSGASHGDVAGPISVGTVCRDLQHTGRELCPGQAALLHGCVQRGANGLFQGLGRGGYQLRHKFVILSLILFQTDKMFCRPGFYFHFNLVAAGEV